MCACVCVHFCACVCVKQKLKQYFDLSSPVLCHWVFPTPWMRIHVYLAVVREANLTSKGFLIVLKVIQAPHGGHRHMWFTFFAVLQKNLDRLPLTQLPLKLFTLPFLLLQRNLPTRNRKMKRRKLWLKGEVFVQVSKLKIYFYYPSHPCI